MRASWPPSRWPRSSWGPSTGRRWAASTTSTATATCSAAACRWASTRRVEPFFLAIMQSAAAATFDEAYYQRYYFDKKTKVVDPQHVEWLGAFVCSYLRYLRVPMQRVLDVGCGIGLWRDIIARHFPSASYHGVEFSEYLCGRYGW